MNEQKLKELFSATFEVPVEQVNDTLEYQTIPLWDSIGHMALIAALDREFEVMLDTDEIIDLSSFKKAKDILSRHGVSMS